MAAAMADRPDGLDTGLAGLLILARYLGAPADGDRLRREIGRPGEAFGERELLRGARRLGLKARAVDRRRARLALAPLPALALLRDGRYVIVARATDERVLVHDPAASQPALLLRARFDEAWSGRLILVGKAGARPRAERAFTLAWFVPAIAKYRVHLGEVLAASFVLQLLGLLAPLFTQVVIDKVLVHHATTTLDVLAVGMLAVGAFEALLGGLRTYLFAHTSSRIDVELGARVFRHLLGLPLAYFEARRAGDTVARVRELEGIRQFLTGTPTTLVIDAGFTLVFLAVMLLYSGRLTAIVVGALPAYVALALTVTPILRARLDERFNRGADSQAFLVECVTGMATVKALALEPDLGRRWEEHLAGYVRAGFRATSLASAAGQVAAFVSRVTGLAILWVGARLVMGGALSVGELIAFNMLAARVSGPVLRLVQLWQEFQQVGISVRRLGDLLDAPLEAPAGSSRIRLPALAGRVTFEQVAFRYRPGGPEVLRGVSFDLAQGDVVGIVGRSGSGKSTVARLVQRLHVPESGRVLLDGIDVTRLDPAWLRRRVGVVLQESVLFDRSVRENIAAADPAMAAERVVRAAHLAGAHEFILELPGGYDTVVGENGCTLSGGERQRIAIARALAADPAILILDEATSALDYEAERQLAARFPEIARGRTVLLIGHRPALISLARRILVLDGGRVVEQGTHAELLRAGGLYATLYRGGGPAASPGRGRPLEPGAGA